MHRNCLLLPCLNWVNCIFFFLSLQLFVRGLLCENCKTFYYAKTLQKSRKNHRAIINPILADAATQTVRYKGGFLLFTMLYSCYAHDVSYTSLETHPVPAKALVRTVGNVYRVSRCRFQDRNPLTASSGPFGVILARHQCLSSLSTATATSFPPPGDSYWYQNTPKELKLVLPATYLPSPLSTLQDYQKPPNSDGCFGSPSNFPSNAFSHPP